MPTGFASFFLFFTQKHSLHADEFPLNFRPSESFGTVPVFHVPEFLLRKSSKTKEKPTRFGAQVNMENRIFRLYKFLTAVDFKSLCCLSKTFHFHANLILLTKSEANYFRNKFLIKTSTYNYFVLTVAFLTSRRRVRRASKFGAIACLIQIRHCKRVVY